MSRTSPVELLQTLIRFDTTNPPGNEAEAIGYLDGVLAVSGITLKFKGKTAHAAADAHNGQNALNAAVLTYMAIHANRQQLRRDANPVVHGIITEGGLANNIIPDRPSSGSGSEAAMTPTSPSSWRWWSIAPRALRWQQDAS